MPHFLSLFSRKRCTKIACCVLITASVGLGGCKALNKPRPIPPKPFLPMTQEANETYYYLLLDEAMRNNNIKAAERAIARLLPLNPGVPVYIDATRFYLLQQQPSIARDIVKEGLSVHTDDFNLTIALVETYAQEKRFEAGALVLKDYLKRHPEEIQALQELGLLYYRNKQYPEAVDTLTSQQDEFRSPLTRYYLAKALTQVGRLDDAEGELKKAVEEKEDFVEGWAELAYVQELKKDFISAEATYEQIIRLGQAGNEVWIRLISLNLKLNRPDKAAELVHLGPTQPSFTLQAASAFMDEGFHKQAEVILKNLLNKPNPPAEVYFHLAVLAYEADKDLNKAEKMLQQIPDHNRFWDKSIIFRSKVLYEMGQKDKALAVVRHGRTVDPGNRAFWTLESDFLGNMKRYKEGMKTLEEAMNLWPGDTELLFRKASLFDSLGDRVAATELMEQVILADPEHPMALNYVGYMLADNDKDLDRALVLIEKANKLEPGQDFILDSLAWVHYKLGNYEKAWEFIQQAIDAEDPSWILWDHYGDIAVKVNKLDAAKKAYKKVLELEPDDPEQIQKKLDAIK